MAFDFGYRLKFLRKKKKLSQKQVAERVHVSKASISGYENNLTMPSVDVLVKLALLYGVTTDYLTGLDNRKMVSLDGFTESQQKAVMDTIEIFRKLLNPVPPSMGIKKGSDF
ncbi:MAG: helix-turn-helix transcriptional regulator [Provencibacterium sp.]|jgi:transcriptional regulator with XRE-family HTH domain|nr:helix-turn-helix transcriptional regulator [Provencibacterium sp.]